MPASSVSPLTPLVSEPPADSADRRILVFIQPATAAAHMFRRDREGGRYHTRVGRSTIEARNGMLRDLLVCTGALEHRDHRVCPDATERDLGLLALRDALNRMNVPIPEGRIEQYLSEDASLSPFVPSLCVREEGCPPLPFRTGSDGVVCMLPAHPRHVLRSSAAVGSRPTPSNGPGEAS